MSVPRQRASTAARLALAGFCWLTALYGFVTSSAFSYLQFIKPRVFPWVGHLSDWHAVASVFALALLVVALWSDLRGPVRAVRTLSRLGLFLSGAAVAWNLFSPVMPALTDGARSVWVGVLALLPLVWLAALDLLGAAAYLRAQRTAEQESEHQRFEGRLLTAVMATAVAMTILYAVLAAIGLVNRFEPDLLIAGQALGFGVSLVYHFTILVSLFLLLAALGRFTGGRFILQYGLFSLVFVGLVATAFARSVGDALSFHGFPAALASSATAVSIIGTWTGLRLRGLARSQTPIDSALDLYFGASRRTGPEFVRVAFVGMFAFVVFRVSRQVDWDFALLDSGVLISCMTLLALAYQQVGTAAARSSWLVALFCVAPLGASLGLSSLGSMRATVDRYAVYNPSFRIAESILGNNGQAISSLDRYLRANTGLTDVPVAPINIDFVANLGPAPGPPPSMFLFVIDSLRPDYLAPYNPAVRFTPRIGEFAAESVVFTNAITRYGGTGLSVPAMWVGSAIIHKQYVTPFHPMNTVEKLLDANHYRRIIGLDSIMGQLLRPSSDIDELDRGRPVMEYELCRTLGELESKLPADGRQAVFAYSLPQDIHMSKLQRIVDSGDEYRSFHAPYATKVHAIDSCFGRFVDTLKAKGLYDDSLIVLTADHGEMLGEDGRFGHSYHLFPQIVRVPLIVHLPASVKQRASLDSDAVSLTTDIAPTMYAALGYDPVRSNHLMGRSLIGADEAQSLARRRERVVIAASYGAVYAVASHNGRRLYVADAVRGGEQAFEQDRSGQWAAVEVTPGLRAVNQFAIRQYVDELSRQYRLGGRN